MKTPLTVNATQKTNDRKEKGPIITKFTQSQVDGFVESAEWQAFVLGALVGWGIFVLTRLLVWAVQKAGDWCTKTKSEPVSLHAQLDYGEFEQLAASIDRETLVVNRECDCKSAGVGCCVEHFGSVHFAAAVGSRCYGGF